MEGICESKWIYVLVGILFVVIGFMLWRGDWSLEQAIAGVIIVVGLKELAYHCGPTK